MTTETKNKNTNLNFHVFLFLFLVLLSEVLLVYITYKLVKPKSDINCSQSCTENEIWKVINTERFSGVLEEKVNEIILEIKNKQELILNTKLYIDPTIRRTKREDLLGSSGPPGPPGPQGPPGLPGYCDGVIIGEKGDVGAPGLPGQKGERGFDGRDGFPGPPGHPGMKGDIGYPGMQGEKGDVGNPGQKGERGFDGMNGAPALIPPSGQKGEVGYPGPQGEKGERGFGGLHGRDGIPGLPGYNGLKGEPGTPGQPGPRGLPGPASNCVSNNPDIEVHRYGNEVYPDLFFKKTDKVINSIGGPDISVLYNRNAMSDLSLNVESQLLWETVDTDRYTLLEYNDLESFLNNDSSRTYELYQSFDEGSKVIYNKNFYYKSTGGHPGITKYSLDGNTDQVLGIPELTRKNLKRLYNDNSSYFDFNVDENGLWVIFAVPNINNTGILKINTDNWTIENAWNITLNHSEFTGMFIDSGILYPVQNLKIPYACDLCKNKCYTTDLDLKDGPTLLPAVPKMWYNHKNKTLYMATTSDQYEYSILFNESDLENIKGIEVN